MEHAAERRREEMQRMEERGDKAESAHLGRRLEMLFQHDCD